MHGPTFMGNPLACAVACASIRLLVSSDWQNSIAHIEQKLTDGLSPALNAPGVRDVRCLGGIGVVEMKDPVDMAVIQKKFVEKGVWIRPFGRLVYTMPPYIMSDPDLDILTGAMVEIIRAL
jgi:adenosylmethionine-8-amino-7-oxononanoate aminotransferase